MKTRLHQPNTGDSAPAPVVTGLLAGSRVRTLDGILPVDYLAPGDRIVTRAGARRLVGVSVLTVANANLIRVRASSLGHDRPDQDLLLSPGQPVVIRDWRAKLLYGATVAVVPVARLADGEFVLAEFHRKAKLYTLRFEDDEVIYAEGLELACAAIAREPACH